jgi:hypothetical protein
MLETVKAAFKDAVKAIAQRAASEPPPAAGKKNRSGETGGACVIRAVRKLARPISTAFWLAKEIMIHGGDELPAFGPPDPCNPFDPQPFTEPGFAGNFTEDMPPPCDIGSFPSLDL